ncbi:hypothetical protein FPQ18DRAFT_334845 [Pyronema domesticum]|uniref:Uncharacterized protein n=1 Tax=Pyronema omphalodes (strain CBS 100304) TaxID=1076935 RepID=U4LTL5_PYROM|nr:hypothetical protein FPQ18DRAFT_334845 [Pyronema domesticum]CCX30891.1 Similar to hypothetical protein [Tuber melanosporum Mel28]; acc. no. XP_002841285 [Pyronema omphalodes CBS 100304]
MGLSCFSRPHGRRGERKERKTRRVIPRCSACLEPCEPVIFTPGDEKPLTLSPVTTLCQHVYHPQCMRNLWLSMRDGPPARCCGRFIPFSIVFQIFDELHDRAEISKFLVMFRAKTARPVDCLSCKKWILPEDIDEQLGSAYCNPAHGGCGGNTCVFCGKEGHIKGPVKERDIQLFGKRSKSKKEEVEERKVVCMNTTQQQQEEILSERLFAKHGWERCRAEKCGVRLSRYTGCQEVICKCGQANILPF